MGDWIIAIGARPGTHPRTRECRSLADLESELDSLQRAGEGTLLVESPSGDFLLVGIEGHVAFAQFCPDDPPGVPISKCRPVQWATQGGATDKFVEFNIGGTATDISMEFCIEPSLMKAAALHYLATEELLETVNWLNE